MIEMGVLYDTEAENVPCKLLWYHTSGIMQLKLAARQDRLTSLSPAPISSLPDLASVPQKKLTEK
jgi:hypothetical protein